MSDISQMLRDHSEQIQDQLKQHAECMGVIELTKQAAVASLVEQGVSETEASEMVKSAEEFDDLIPRDVKLDPVFVSTVLIKSADYIEQLQQDIEVLQTKIKNSEELSKVASALGPVAESLQDIGFSKEQVNILAGSEMLDKVAHLVGRPWEPGVSSGQPSVQSMDPIERFCFGVQ